MFGSNIIHMFQLLLIFYNGVYAQSNSYYTGYGYSPGDGHCDASYNNKQFNYDEGDCCECTCVDGSYPCNHYNVFSCMDPNSGCLDPRATEYPNCTGYISVMEDGSCDQHLNNPECGFDGGDCCECGSYYHPFLCLDPDSGCVNPRAAEFSNCTGDLAYAGDGSCDDFNNNPACGFDWEDCCFCTFVEVADRYTLEDMFDPWYTAEFDCLDPNAGDELYGCMASPLPPLPCPGDSDNKLVVERLADVNNLAETVYCTGGEFEVEWKGHIVVDEGIVVPTGTVLNITGIGPNAIIDGGGVTRLFTVVNGTLHVTNLRMTNGSSVFGGAIYSSGSKLTFNGTSFVGNAASVSGGALLVSDGSNVSFRETIFSANKGQLGGALHLSNGRALWEETTTFSANTADLSGGAVYVSDGGDASWVGVTTFSGNNSASDYGGAVCVVHDGNASWAGETTFSENTADLCGGAIHVDYDGSKASWTGVMTFSENIAGLVGGAISLYGEVWWAGETIFSGNVGYYQGGAVSAVGGEIRCSSTAKATFISNIATNEGGALHSDYGGRVSWGADTLFFNNTANLGGALFVASASYVAFEGETNFTANTAFSDGGAVGSSPPSDSFGYTVSGSDIVFNSSTSFLNNSAGANGGGIVLLGALSILFNTINVVFYGNFANVAGGGVYLSATAIGPTFNETTFDSNSAKMGGGIYATGSGTIFERDSRGQNVTYYPVTFIGCTFVNNVAEVSGGAVITASGRYKFLETSFVLNLASVGGALRLTDEASLDACSFVENMSDPDEGPAVSNLGIISNFRAGNFKDNKYVCGIHTFFGFAKSQKKGERFGKVCSGCLDTQCKDCDFEEPNLVPQCISLSEAGIEHADSSGGLSTVEHLLIFKGYWRATNTSTDVKKCYNANACPGGLTTSNYCNPGYSGPYCAVCRQGYMASLGFTCNKCTDSTKGITMAFVFTVISVAVLAAAVWYLMSSEIRGEERSIMGQVVQRLPVQSGKIIIVAWQILTQFASVVNVTFPNVYQDFLDGVNILNFDISWVASPGCFMNYDFYNRLLLTTIGPVGTIGLLVVTYAIAKRRNRASETALRTVRQKHASVALLVIFFLYSNVSSVVFQTFSCDALDDGNSYLRADYSIECYNKEHRAYQIYATIMIFVYPVGIPALFAGLLFRNKQVLQDNARSKEDLVTKSTTSLWEPYKPSRFYYEVIECFRRILLTGVVVFIYPGSAAQIAVTYMMAAFFAMMAEILSPYKSKWDAWVSRAGHALVITSMFLALLLKVDVSDEESSSEKIFELVLVAAHACVVVTVVVEAMAMACALKVTCRRRDPTNRALCPWMIDASLVGASRRNDTLNGEGGVEHKAELEEEKY